MITFSTTRAAFDSDSAYQDVWREAQRDWLDERDSLDDGPTASEVAGDGVDPASLRFVEPLDYLSDEDFLPPGIEFEDLPF